MRKVLIEKEVFKFEELDREAQNKVIENEMEVWQDYFEMDIQYFLEENFPNSDLQYQYSLNSCQGDGFNFYGRIRIKDVISKMKFDKEEEKIFSEIDKYSANSIKKLLNRSDCYSLTGRDDFGFDEIIEEVEDVYKCNPADFSFSFVSYENLIKKMKETLREFFINAEIKLEKYGYDVLYPKAEDLIEDGYFDEYEYFGNGDIFNESEV